MEEHIKNVVLVHGAFADGSGWEAVAVLKNDGYKVSVPQPQTSTPTTIKYTKTAIDAMDEPVVLVGLVMAGHHHHREPVIIQRLRRLSMLPHLRSTKVSCASSNRPCAQASKAFQSDSNNNWWDTRSISRPTSQRTARKIRRRS